MFISIQWHCVSLGKINAPLLAFCGTQVPLKPQQREKIVQLKDYQSNLKQQKRHDGFTLLSEFFYCFHSEELLLWNTSQHSGLVVTPTVSQPEGPGFKSRSARLISKVSWVCPGFGRTFLGGVCVFTPCLRGFPSTIKTCMLGTLG